MSETERIHLLLMAVDNRLDLALQQYFSAQPALQLRVEQASRAEAALAFLRGESVDVIVLDLALPEAHGLEALIRIHSQAPDIPILALTAPGDEALGLKALHRGAEECLMKDRAETPVLGLAVRHTLERHRVRQSLIRSENLQALSTLAGGIAHDFNNILLAVSGNARLALEQLAPEHASHSFVEEISKAAHRAGALTSKILSFSRQKVLKIEPVNLQCVAEEVFAQLRLSMPARILLTTNLPHDLPRILADAAQLRQIVANLAANAGNAIGEGTGSVEISARVVQQNNNGSSLAFRLAPGFYVKLSLKDTGPGMDKKTMGRVFEPFFTPKSQGRGTGMGLAMLPGIMKSHEGEITISSEMGKGTVFNLYFPVARDSGAEVVLEPSAPRGRGEQILYVDDEEPLVLLVSRTLRRLGYKVAGFTNPVEALRALRASPESYHAIVTDLSMPQMSGTDLAQEALELCPKIPIILTTGYIRPQDQEVARRLGVRELILKPDSVEELGNVLHRLLGADPPTPSLAAAARVGQ